MQRDIRETAFYHAAEALHRVLRQPGSGLISEASEVSTNGTAAVFTGTLVDVLEGVPPTRICLTHLATGDTRVLTFGPNIDRLPKFSPNGQQVAFLSDRGRSGDFQLCLLDPSTGMTRPTPKVDGWVEYLHWSPDGRRILLGVAGHGADISGGQGAMTSQQQLGEMPSWMPSVETGDESYRWRSAWVYELETHRVRRVSQSGVNIWEGVWCGNDALAAVVSPGPGEGLWYSARLARVELNTGETSEVYAPKQQLGWPAASPSGEQLVVVEAICSDRWIVAGDLRLIDAASGRVRRLENFGLDVTYTQWCSNRRVLLAGHRGFETVVGVYDIASEAFTEVWSSAEVTTGGRYVSVSGVNESADCVLVGESYVRAPEIAVIRGGEYRTVKSFDVGYAERAQSIDAVERVSWSAPDGLEIQGWLLRPKGHQPHPIVMSLHGGPIWHWRPMWLGRSRDAPALRLVESGYAVFFPNPRGSGGRGQKFASLVSGDMGGAETQDHLSGLDYLVDQGIADPKRLGVWGVSHGGFMTSWLIGQDSRFAAAVPVAPVINWVSEHLVSNIPTFCAGFLNDHYTNPGGMYFHRSPLMHAHKVKTPTLNICGAGDRCTPPEEALQFHNALLENGVKSALITYPEEGHGVRKFPTSIDYVARLAIWFDAHMPTKLGP